MKKSDVQRIIAVSVMSSGVLLGLWISSANGPRAEAQADAGALPPPSEALPPPAEALPPPSEALPPPAESLPPPAPALPPATEGALPPPPTNDIPSLPPDVPQGIDPSNPQAQDLLPPPPVDGLQMQMPEEFTFTTVNPEGFIYNPDNLRDPFFPIKKGKPEVTADQETKQPNEMDFNPQDPLQAYLLNEYKLVGVMWDVREPRAMVLTPDNKLYTIKRKIRLGREGAVIAAIRESEIVVVEPNPDGTYVNASTRVITMKR